MTYELPPPTNPPAEELPFTALCPCGAEAEWTMRRYLTRGEGAITIDCAACEPYPIPEGHLG